MMASAAWARRRRCRAACVAWDGQARHRATADRAGSAGSCGAAGHGDARVGQAGAGGRADRCAGRDRYRAVGHQGQGAASRSTSCSAGHGGPRCRSMPRSAATAIAQLDEVLRVVEARLKDKPAAIKIRFDNNRTQLDSDIPATSPKRARCARLVGDGFPLAFDANNGCSTGGAIRVGRALEDLGFWWFEEPVQHYHVKAMGEVTRSLDITVSAGEQTYTLAALADLIDAGVRMVQPDIVKMGGITGLMRCAALGACTRRGTGATSDAAHDRAYGKPAVVAAQLHATKPCEWNDPSSRTHAVFANPPGPQDGLFHLPAAPGLGLHVNEAELASRRVD